MHYQTIFGPFCPKQSNLGQKSSHLNIIRTLECKIRPFSALFSQNSHISDSPKKNDNFGNYLETLVISTFSRNYRLFNPSSIFTRHFIPFLWNNDFEFYKRPILDLFASESQILNKSPKYSDDLGILGRYLDSSGISNVSKVLQTMFLYYPILQWTNWSS